MKANSAVINKMAKSFVIFLKCRFFFFQNFNQSVFKLFDLAVKYPADICIIIFRTNKKMLLVILLDHQKFISRVRLTWLLLLNSLAYQYRR